MSNVITIDNFEVIVAVLLFDEGLGNLVREFSHTVGVGGFNIDLLNLGGTSDLI